MILVTKTHLPDIQRYEAYLKKIYASRWLTNDGQCVHELTQNLEKYLGVKNVLLVANATLGLQIAYKLLGLSGEVITSPLSFVATTSSLIWEGLTPVFADIDPKTACVDPNKIEEKITDKTTAILPVHVYGNACEIEEIQEIATRHNLKVIYDAAHAFGVQYKNGSILKYGDVSLLSFHATKLFHTAEGGALIIKDDLLFKKAKSMLNFGFDPDGSGEISRLGINAKMSELHAAMGLCVLEDMDKVLRGRKAVFELYSKLLKNHVSFLNHSLHSTQAYAYFPVLFKNEAELLEVTAALQAQNIFPRRYFYPSLNALPYLHYMKMPISEDIAKRVLCLPMFEDLGQDSIVHICNIIREVLSQ